MKSLQQLIGRWRMSPAVLGPAIVFVVISAAAVVGFILWSTADLDRLTIERERQLVGHVLKEQVRKISYDQESVTIWDDAVANTQVAFDPKWVDVNLGVWMKTYFGHDRVFVLDAANNPIYVMNDGAAADPSTLAADLPVLAPIIAELRIELDAGAVAAYKSGARQNYPSSSDIAFIEGRPAIISASPITSDTAQWPTAPGAEYLHISVIFLDAEQAEAMGRQYLLADASFAITETADADKATYPIMSRDGRFVTFFEWRPYQPGRIILSQTVPAIGAAFLIGSAVIFLLLDQLWRSAAALRAGRADAKHQAAHDALTGLPNRVQFDAQLTQALSARRSKEFRIALLMLDLDRFKQINDTLGHQAGDDLLRAVGQRLKELIGNRDMLARLGGDEFAIIHPTRAGEREALLLSEHIIDAIEKPFDVFGSEAFVGVSIGVAVASDDDTDALDLIRRADIALYEAKAAGRNRAAVYEDAMGQLLQGRHAIESELREALRRTDQLTVAFQPLFSRETGRITGAEALARWTHPRLGQVSPAQFIPVAEATGLIEALGELVIRKACEVGARWPGQTVAVNISPRQLKNENFPNRVFEILKATGMRAEDLELEITESILLEDEHVTSTALTVFRAAGIRIALDDFGTGYSSLNYLKRYPVDRIKIDRSFVGQLSPDGVTVAIVQAMVTLAHALKIEVTAEGVETHEQMQMLSAMGCNTFQGFLLSAPVTPAVIENLFRGHVRKIAEVA